MGTTAELQKVIAVKQHQRARAGSWKSAVTVLQLSKYAGRRRPEAASIIALFWRERAARKRADARQEALLTEQETLLLNAVAEVRAERDRRAFDHQYKRARSSRLNQFLRKLDRLTDDKTSEAMTLSRSLSSLLFSASTGAGGPAGEPLPAAKRSPRRDDEEGGGAAAANGGVALAEGQQPRPPGNLLRAASTFDEDIGTKTVWW